jgi:predicted Rossmann fold nucleotide-binding protein DprA/Smf involved in DNA uptake
MSEGEAMIFRMLRAEGTYVDEIAAQCRIPISQALSTLTMLELKGLIRQYSGKRFAPA